MKEREIVRDATYYSLLIAGAWATGVCGFLYKANNTKTPRRPKDKREHLVFRASELINQVLFAGNILISTEGCVVISADTPTYCGKHETVPDLALKHRFDPQIVVLEVGGALTAHKQAQLAVVERASLPAYVTYRQILAGQLDQIDSVAQQITRTKQAKDRVNLVKNLAHIIIGEPVLCAWQSIAT